jgi:restriction system protein
MRFLWWGKKDKAPKATPPPKPEARPPKGKAVETRPPAPKAEPWSDRIILDHLLKLNPTEFEHAVARLLPLIGYTSASHTGKAGDLGVDIVCYDAHGGLVAVQCKRYASSKKVTSSDIATFFGMIVRRAARQGIYVTTSGFTKAALSLAAEQDIRTIDGAGIAALFARHPAALDLGQLWEQQGGRTSQVRECRYCHRMIQLREMPDGKWMPFDDVGTRHDCRARRP